jgi:hypothetical protein
MPAILQGAHCHPSEWPLTCYFSNPRRVKTAICPRGVRSSRVCLVSATQVLDHVPRSPAESRCVPFSRCHPAIPGAGRGTSLRRRKLSHLRNPVSAAISHKPRRLPARTGTGAAEPILTLTTPASPPSCPPPAELSRPTRPRPSTGAPDARTPRAAGASRHLPSQPGSDPPARLMTPTDL